MSDFEIESDEDDDLSSFNYKSGQGSQYKNKEPVLSKSKQSKSFFGGNAGNRHNDDDDEYNFDFDAAPKKSSSSKDLKDKHSEPMKGSKIQQKSVAVSSESALEKAQNMLNKYAKSSNNSVATKAPKSPSRNVFSLKKPSESFDENDISLDSNDDSRGGLKTSRNLSRKGSFDESKTLYGSPLLGSFNRDDDESVGGLRSFGRLDSVDQLNLHEKLYDFNGDDEDISVDSSQGRKKKPSPQKSKAPPPVFVVADNANTSSKSNYSTSTGGGAGSLSGVGVGFGTVPGRVGSVAKKAPLEDSFENISYDGADDDAVEDMENRRVLQRGQDFSQSYTPDDVEDEEEEYVEREEKWEDEYEEEERVGAKSREEDNEKERPRFASFSDLGAITGWAEDEVTPVGGGGAGAVSGRSGGDSPRVLSNPSPIEEEQEEEEYEESYMDYTQDEDEFDRPVTPAKLSPAPALKVEDRNVPSSAASGGASVKTVSGPVTRVLLPPHAAPVPVPVPISIPVPVPVPVQIDARPRSSQAAGGTVRESVEQVPTIVRAAQNTPAPAPMPISKAPSTERTVILPSAAPVSQSVAAPSSSSYAQAVPSRHGESLAPPSLSPEPSIYHQAPHTNILPLQYLAHQPQTVPPPQPAVAAAPPHHQHPQGYAPYSLHPNDPNSASSSFSPYAMPPSSIAPQNGQCPQPYPPNPNHHPNYAVPPNPNPNPLHSSVQYPYPYPPPAAGPVPSPYGPTPGYPTHNPYHHYPYAPHPYAQASPYSSMPYLPPYMAHSQPDPYLRSSLPSHPVYPQHPLHGLSASSSGFGGGMGLSPGLFNARSLSVSPAAMSGRFSSTLNNGTSINYNGDSSSPAVQDLLRDLKEAKDDASWAKARLSDMISMMGDSREEGRGGLGFTGGRSYTASSSPAKIPTGQGGSGQGFRGVGSGEESYAGSESHESYEADYDDKDEDEVDEVDEDAEEGEEEVEEGDGTEYSLDFEDSSFKLDVGKALDRSKSGPKTDPNGKAGKSRNSRYSKSGGESADSNENNIENNINNNDNNSNKHSTNVSASSSSDRNLHKSSRAGPQRPDSSSNGAGNVQGVRRGSRSGGLHSILEHGSNPSHSRSGNQNSTNAYDNNSHNNVNNDFGGTYPPCNPSSVSSIFEMSSPLLTSQALFRQQLNNLRDRMNLNTHTYNTRPYLSALGPGSAPSAHTPCPTLQEVKQRFDSCRGSTSLKLWEVIQQVDSTLGEDEAKQLAGRYTVIQ